MKMVCFAVMEGSRIGWGHSRRSAVLREQFIAQGIPTRWHVFENEEQAERCYREIILDKPEYLIVDMPVAYMDTHFFDEARRSGITLVLMDDGAEFGYRQPQDWLVACSSVFDVRAERGSRDLMGSKYVILNKQFEKYADLKRNVSAEVKQVLLSFGGTDPNRILPRVLQAFKQITAIRLKIYAVLGNSGMAMPQHEVHAYPHEVTFIEQLPHLADVLWEADVAVISGGMTLFEACSLGTPVITVNQVHDQDVEAHAYHIIGAIHNIGMHDGFQPEAFIRTFNEMRDPLARARMSEAARSKIDGAGSSRIVKALLTNEWEER